MRIVCPACAAAYDVPDDRIATGRVVRCARCATDWVPRPQLARELEPEPEPEPEFAPDARPESVEEPRAEAEAAPAAALTTPAVGAGQRDPARRRAAGLGLALAWVASVAVILAGLAGAVTARERVMQAWPPSIRAYHVLGLK